MFLLWKMHATQRESSMKHRNAFLFCGCIKEILNISILLKFISQITETTIHLLQEK